MIINNKYEFINQLNNYGISKENYGIHIDEIGKKPGDISIKKKMFGWVVVNIEKDGTKRKSKFYKEHLAFQELHKLLILKLNEIGQMNEYITDEVIDVKVGQAISWLTKNTGTFVRAENVKRNFKLLNEVKYCSITDKFMPKNQCISTIDGETAESIMCKYNLPNKAYAYLKLFSIINDESERDNDIEYSW